MGLPGASAGSLQKGSWKAVSDSCRSSRELRISSRLGGDIRGLRTRAPPPAPRSRPWHWEPTERGELPGVVVEVRASPASGRSPVGELSLSTKEAEVRGRACTGSRADRRNSLRSHWKSWKGLRPRLVPPEEPHSLPDS